MATLATTDDVTARAKGDGSGVAIGDVLIWVLIPALSYLAGALFQAGYNNYFGLPDEVLNSDPVATFHASRRYLDLIAHHFSPSIGITIAFLIYLAALPTGFYRAHAIVALVLAAGATFVSFSIRPFAWALASAAVLVAIQLSPLAARQRPQLVSTSPTAVKALVIVAFFYATLFSAGNESARFATDFFITGGSSRYVILALNDKDAIAAELLGPTCARVTALPSYLEGYHFDRDIKAFTLGDTDTPKFQLFETNGLTSSAACATGRTRRTRSWIDAIWI